MIIAVQSPTGRLAAALKGLVRRVIHCVKVAPFDSRMDEPRSWRKDTVKFSTSKKCDGWFDREGGEAGSRRNGAEDAL